MRKLLYYIMLSRYKEVKGPTVQTKVRTNKLKANYFTSRSEENIPLVTRCNRYAEIIRYSAKG
jgi:hypothetical protein